MLEEQLGKLLKQAQKMQSDLTKTQEELKNKRVEAVVDAGSVRVVADGRQKIIDIMLDPGIIHPANSRVIQQLLVEAVNKALENSKNLARQEMNKATGGLNLPNIPGLF